MIVIIFVSYIIPPDIRNIPVFQLCLNNKIRNDGLG